MTSTPMSCTCILKLALISALSRALGALCAWVCPSSDRYLTHNPLLTISIIPWDVQFKMASDSVARIKHLRCTISGTRRLNTARGILCRCRSGHQVRKSLTKTKKKNENASNTYLYPWSDGVICRINRLQVRSVKFVAWAKQKNWSLIKRLFGRNILRNKLYIEPLLITLSQ